MIEIVVMVVFSSALGASQEARHAAEFCTVTPAAEIAGGNMDVRVVSERIRSMRTVDEPSHNPAMETASRS